MFLRTLTFIASGKNFKINLNRMCKIYVVLSKNDFSSL